jgi:hypothetical protein
MGNIHVFSTYGEMRYAYPERRYHLRYIGVDILRRQGYGGEGWIQPAQDSDLWQALVKTVWASSGFFLGGR